MENAWLRIGFALLAILGWARTAVAQVACPAGACNGCALTQTFSCELPFEVPAAGLRTCELPSFDTNLGTLVGVSLSGTVKFRDRRFQFENLDPNAGCPGSTSPTAWTLTAAGAIFDPSNPSPGTPFCQVQVTCDDIIPPLPVFDGTIDFGLTAGTRCKTATCIAGSGFTQNCEAVPDQACSTVCITSAAGLNTYKSTTTGPTVTFQFDDVAAQAQESLCGKIITAFRVRVGYTVQLTYVYCNSPVANPDSLRTCAGIPQQIDVLANDNPGVNGATFNCASLTVNGPPAGQGTVTKVNCSGATCTQCVLSYNPGAFIGNTSFSYTVQNSLGCPSTTTVSVLVAPNPTANPDSLTVCAGATGTVNVLSNDLPGTGASFNCSSLQVTGPPAGQGSVTKLNCTGDTCTECVLQYNPGAFIGNTSFTYSYTNSVGCSAQSTVNVTVNPNPTALNDTLAVCAGANGTVNVLANDSAGAGATFNCNSLTVNGPPAGQGTVTKLNCTGATCTQCVLQYAPGAFVGGTSFTYSFLNSFGCPASATVNVTVNPNPTALNDTLTTCGSVAAQINLLANDSAGAGATFNCNSLTLTGPAAGQGTVTKINCTGATCTQCVVEYSPGAFVGNTSFTYSFLNSFGCPGQATVNVTVNPNPTAVNDALTLCAGATAQLNVLANDSAGAGATFNCNSLTVTGPAAGQGTVTKLNCTGATCTQCVLQYVPGTFVGNTSFTYSFLNSFGCPAQATVNVTVNPNPTAVNDTLTTCGGVTAQINVLANDSAGAGATFNCNSLTVTGPAAGQGTVTKLNCTGATCTQCVLQYVPGTFVGNTSFTYSFLNSFGCPAQATVSVTVNPNPTAVNDALAACAGVTSQINVLANDSPGAGATFNCNSLTVTGPVAGQGTVTKLSCSGATCTQCVLEYNPGAFVGNTSFTYSFLNSFGCTAQATVNVTINPNPTAVNDALTTCAGVSAQVNVLANDSAGAGATFNCNSLTVTGPAAGQGTVTKVNCTGATCTQCVLEYSPGAFVGNTTFTYAFLNSFGCPAQATVNVTVRPNPNTGPDSLTTCAGQAKQLDVLANDTPGAGASFNCNSLTVTGPPAGQGTVTKVNCTGPTCTQCVLEYNPGAFVGNTSFSYTVQNSFGCASLPRAVAVTVKPPPNAADDSGLLTCRNTPITIDVLANDVPADGRFLVCNTLAILSGPTNNAGTAVPTACTGTAQSCINTCRVVFTPNPSFLGTTSFVYEITDNNGCKDTATVNLRVCAPTTVNDNAELCEGDTVDINVLGNDTTAQGCGVLSCASIVIVNAPDHGTAVLTGCVGTAPCTGCRVRYTYTDNAFFSSDSFTYTVRDQNGCISNTATVTIAVKPKPEVVDCSFTKDPNSDAPIQIPFLTCGEPDADPGQGCTFACNSVVLTSQPTQGQVTINPNCTFTFTPSPTFDGEDFFCYRIFNSCGCFDEGCIRIVEPDPTCIERNRRICGSLLLYPEYSNRPGEMTIYTITDACCDFGQSTWVEFIFIRENTCLEENRTFFLTPCDTLTMLTSAAVPNKERGYAYAYAKVSQNVGSAPKVFNHLVGNLLFFSGWETLNYGMNAVSFRGIGPEGSLTDKDQDGVLDLDGLEYEEAPDELLIPRFLGQDSGAIGMKSRLILVAMSGGTAFNFNGGTEVLFNIYDDNENANSATYKFYCWKKPLLTDISGAFLNSFLASPIDDPDEPAGWPAREAGWFRLNGRQAHSPQETIDDPAVYAVLVEHWTYGWAADLPFEYCSQQNADLLPNNLLGDPRPGFPAGILGDDQ
ncbi:MAG: Ig-like domain-containing protein [Planctomycetota bacterium]